MVKNQNVSFILSSDTTNTDILQSDKVEVTWQWRKHFKPFCTKEVRQSAKPFQDFAKN